MREKYHYSADGHPMNELHPLPFFLSFFFLFSTSCAFKYSFFFLPIHQSFFLLLSPFLFSCFFLCFSSFPLFSPPPISLLLYFPSLLPQVLLSFAFLVLFFLSSPSFSSPLLSFSHPPISLLLCFFYSFPFLLLQFLLFCFSCPLPSLLPAASSLLCFSCSFPSLLPQVLLSFVFLVLFLLSSPNFSSPLLSFSHPPFLFSFAFLAPFLLPFLRFCSLLFFWFFSFSPLLIPPLLCFPSLTPHFSSLLFFWFFSFSPLLIPPLLCFPSLLPAVSSLLCFSCSFPSLLPQVLLSFVFLVLFLLSSPNSSSPLLAFSPPRSFFFPLLFLLLSFSLLLQFLLSLPPLSLRHFR
ncbi:uncharacterized protein LOC127539864 isoform X2 [Antechinus flavipes]|uniref:uncharacterized protein LOC127539864 isoform X2 n=1 Tax=Antechinus flavipes TaxID=38775 RepID=UPI0022357D41|nr:uncharacterized protein LOC127539864 isoform X2 [Antechinus flavipes]